MATLTSLKTLQFAEALDLRQSGAAFIDLRPIDEYLEVHIPGSLALLYEFGPGMAARARDCVPLGLPLILLDLGAGDIGNAAASLRGKGFSVLGVVTDAIDRWGQAHGACATTSVVGGHTQPEGRILDVGDPGAARREGWENIPIELLWGRVHQVDVGARLVVVAGYGVRAALAVGMLERAGAEDVIFWKTREPKTS